MRLMHPKLHKTSHQDGGDDEISVANLSGKLADPQLADLEYTHVHAEMYHEVIAGTWAVVVNAAMMYNFYFKNSTSAINDEISYKIYHKAGSYTLEILGNPDSDCGIITVYIDNVSQGTIDFYAADTFYNILKTLAVTFTTSGLHTIRLKATGKTGSSYRIPYQWLRIKAT